ncbi:hypothetical protein G9A89_005933 [Geosiphon pyriformis]|nr:hypothetical protein G9A89_005933 [Geosiphon pyriformis]
MAHLLRWTSTFIHLQNDCYYQATGVPCDSLVIKSSQKRSYQVSQDCSSSLSMINLSPQEPARKKKFRLETSSETTINPLKVFQNFPYNNNLSNYSRQRESGKESNTNSFTSSDNNNIRPKKSYNETTVGSSSTSEMNLMSQEPFNKLPRLETLSSKRTDTAEMLKRVYIFYRGPICISAGDKKTVWLGLPPQHVLNQAKRHECNAQDILSVIFPKQFQLYKDPVNEIEVYNKVKKIQDSLTNVKLSEEKETFPAFLASAVVLIEEMIYRHADFQCQKFLRQMCPIDDDAINTGNPKDISCPLDQVSKFVKGVLDRLIPEKFWGRKDNKIAIFKSKYFPIVDKFLSLGRYESISMHEVLQGYKMKQSKWLPVRDMVKRKAIISEFLKWTFEGLLIPLLRTNFYITDIQNDGHRVYYFRQDIWHKVSDIEIAHFLNNNFEKLECVNNFPSKSEKIQPLSPTTKASFSSIRLVPKKNGYRPIAKKSFSHINDDLTVKKNQITMNKILLDAFKILALEKERRVEFSNGTVMSTKDVYKRLVDFKKKLPEKRKLYFAKVDVRCCFDSIDQNLLLQIISNLFQSRRYKMIKFTTMSAIGNEYIKTYDKKACPAEDFPCFPLIAERLAESLSHVLFVDGVSYPYREAKEALEFLENHIKQHILKVGDKYYRQKVGIPQGSIISSLLCSFFFEDLEKTKLNFLDKDGVLLRWVDDFLYISTDKAQAIRFLRLMNEGHPEYGCFINPEKTLANFDHEEVKLSPTEFPWCGLLIHTKDLEVKCDYSRTLSTPLRDQMTIMSNISPSTEFQKKLKQFMKKNCSEIFLNTRLNSVATARVNLYQNFLLGAMKFDEYVEELSSRGLKFSDDLVMGIIIDAIKGIYNVIPCEEKSSITWIHKNHAKWLCAHAFWRFFEKKVIFTIQYDKSKPFILDYEATVGCSIAVIKKTAKVSGSNDSFKPVLPRKKRRDNALEDSFGGKVVGSETSNTTEFDSIDIEEECLVEKISFRQESREESGGVDTNMMPKSPKRIVTKHTLEKPLGTINFGMENDDDDDILDGSLFLPPPFSLKHMVQISVRKSFALDINLEVAFFTSDEAMMATAKLANNCGIVVNTNLKHPGNNHMNRTIVLKEIPVGTSVEVVCIAVSKFGASCAICIGFGHTSLNCWSVKDAVALGSRKAPLLAQDQFRLARIYVKKSVLISCPLAFSGKTWVLVVNALPVHASHGAGMSLGFNKIGKPLPPVVDNLESCLVGIKSSLVSLAKQISELAKRLESLVLTVSQPSPGCQLLVTPPPPITELRGGYSDESAGVVIVMNRSLVRHVYKIFEVPGHLLCIRLLFKNKLSVLILGLYTGAFLVTQFSQANKVNSLIVRAVNELSFVILGGDFNEDGFHKCVSFKRCHDLGLVNSLGGSSFAKAPT